MSKDSGEQDWFVAGLKERLPKQMRDSFTDEQLQALKLAFGTRSWGRHPVDLRGTVSFWRSRYYFVFLLGWNKRGLSRSEGALSRFAKSLLIVCFLAFSVLAGLVLLYLVKSAMGIDLFPNYSLGLWGWVKGV
ncbi:MAG: 3-phosphoshikimate 1-carboxyvinyltransferase [Halopseudomonas sp.]